MDWLALGNAMSQLYGYIFCMLVSNALTGMPLFGGALYLCGRMILVYGNIYRKGNRRYLPGYVLKWSHALAAVNVILAVLLIGLYPASFESASAPSTVVVTLVVYAVLNAGEPQPFTKPARCVPSRYQMPVRL